MDRNLMGDLTIMKDMGLKPNFSQLAGKYGMDRHTVRKYWEAGAAPRKKRQDKPSKYAPYLEESRDLLKDPEVSKMAAFQYLADKHPEFPGGYNGYRSFLAKEGVLSDKASAAHPRFETAPGEQIQVDWKENLTLRCKSGREITFNVFSATMGYSRLHLFELSFGKGTDDFVRCLIDTLRRLGGVPREALTDNAAAVVSCTGGGKRKLPKILQLERDLGMRVSLCKARHPYTKGKVESSNRFVDRIKAYDGRVEDEADVARVVGLIEASSNSSPNETTGLPPAVLFRKEKEALGAVPSSVMLEGYVRECYPSVVPQTLLVRCRSSFYSVPAGLVGKRVRAYPIDGRVYVYHGERLVSEHPESQSRINYSEPDYRSALSQSVKDDGAIERMAKANLERLGSL